MDVWIQRIFAIGLVIAMAGMIMAYVNGNDGQVMSFLVGLATGFFTALGVGNFALPVKNEPCPPTSSTLKSSTGK